MIQIREGLERMSLDIAELKDSLLSSSVDPTPYVRHLERTVESLEAKSDRMSPPKPPLDAEEVWARWRMANYDLERLNAREIRTLCVSPKTAMRPRLIAALKSNPEALRRWINFSGFVHGYFAQWRTMDDPPAAEQLIQNLLNKSRNLRNTKVRDLWCRSLFLFSPEAARRLGERIFRERKPVRQTCTEFGIEASTALAVQAHEQAAISAVSELVLRDVRIGQETALTELKWISENLFTPALSAEGYRSGMGKLIVSRLADGMPAFQSALVSLIHADERLGDPRIAYCAQNWRTVSAEAKEKFLAWLAKETLQFFFDTLVPRNDENRRRAEFWLEYAKRQGKIKDFQVAISADDLPKIRASRATTIPRYSSITGGNTSAFLMIFEGYRTEYVVIEFSETGNAAYIYERKAFEEAGATIRSNSFRLKEDLKRKEDKEDRIEHRDSARKSWETNARRKLAELGIRA